MNAEAGRDVIDRLLAQAKLQRVAPDLSAARSLLKAAKRHLVSATTIRATDPEASFTTAYDAARKACAALLEAQGLRASSRGGHIAVRDAVLAQFADLPGGQALRPLDRLRRRRHEIEYLDYDFNLDSEEVDEAIQRSREIVAFADTLLDDLTVY